MCVSVCMCACTLQLSGFRTRTLHIQFMVHAYPKRPDLGPKVQNTQTQQRAQIKYAIREFAFPHLLHSLQQRARIKYALWESAFPTCCIPWAPSAPLLFLSHCLQSLCVAINNVPPSKPNHTFFCREYNQQGLPEPLSSQRQLSRFNHSAYFMGLLNGYLDYNIKIYLFIVCG